MIGRRKRPAGLRLRSNAEASDDLRLDADDCVGVVYPRMEQLLVAQDPVGISDGVGVARDDDAPPRSGGAGLQRDVKL